jgi:hypothetical protein
MKTSSRVAALLTGLVLGLIVSAVALPAAAQETEDAAALEVIDAFAYDPDVRAETASGTAADIAAAHAAAALEAARQDGEYKTIQLDGLLAVRVSSMKALAGPGAGECSAVRLTFDLGVFPNAVPFRCTDDLVVFNLALIDREAETAWQNLVAKRRGTTAYTQISLVPPRGEKPLPSSATDRKIRLYNRWYAALAVFGFVVVTWGFVRLARESNMLRDSGKKRREGEPLRPYSLARVQSAWWFFLVLFSFIFISLINGTLTDIPNTVLGLMGIAGGTFLTSELVDSSRRKRPEYQGRPQAVASREFTGFFNDIFSDAGGVAFHRFQMFVWTLALGGIFVIRVLRNLHMPDFDESILYLMGISSGTYLGMKIPETPKGEGHGNAPAVPGDDELGPGPNPREYD